MAHSDSAKSQLLTRSYAMERFLVRVSLSEYKDNFHLKGRYDCRCNGGLDNRATMDIDTTIRNFRLIRTAQKELLEKVIAVPVQYNMRFEMKGVSSIMDEAEYS